MNVLVCGSRSFGDRQLLNRLLSRLVPDGATIVHGAARGADTLAGMWANENSHPVDSCPANWKKHGKKAGYIRNVYMLNKKPCMVIAFPKGEARGTNHTIKEARKRGILTIVATRGESS